MLNILTDKWVKSDEGVFSPLSLATTETGATQIYLPRPDWEIGLLHLLVYIASKPKLNPADFEKSCFQQVPEVKGKKVKTEQPAGLLINGMGNRLFVEKESFSVNGHLALLALYTFQQLAGVGGSGYRPSPRGASGLAALAWPDGSLFERIQANRAENPALLMYCPRQIRLLWDGDRLEGLETAPYKAPEASGQHPLGVYKPDGKPNGLSQAGLTYRHVALAAAAGKSGSVRLAGFSMANAKPLRWSDRVYKFQPQHVEAGCELYDWFQKTIRWTVRSGLYSEADNRASTDWCSAEMHQFRLDTELAFNAALLDGDWKRYFDAAATAAGNAYQMRISPSANYRRWAAGKRKLEASLLKKEAEGVKQL